MPTVNRGQYIDRAGQQKQQNLQGQQLMAQTANQMQNRKIQQEQFTAQLDQAKHEYKNNLEQRQTEFNVDDAWRKKQVILATTGELLATEMMTQAKGDPSAYVNLSPENDRMTESYFDFLLGDNSDQMLGPLMDGIRNGMFSSEALEKIHTNLIANKEIDVNSIIINEKGDTLGGILAGYGAVSTVEPQVVPPQSKITQTPVERDLSVGVISEGSEQTTINPGDSNAVINYKTQLKQFNEQLGEYGNPLLDNYIAENSKFEQLKRNTKDITDPVRLERVWRSNGYNVANQSAALDDAAAAINEAHLAQDDKQLSPDLLQTANLKQMVARYQNNLGTIVGEIDRVSNAITELKGDPTQEIIRDTKLVTTVPESADNVFNKAMETSGISAKLQEDPDNPQVIALNEQMNIEFKEQLATKLGKSVDELDEVPVGTEFDFDYSKFESALVEAKAIAPMTYTTAMEFIGNPKVPDLTKEELINLVTTVIDPEDLIDSTASAIYTQVKSNGGDTSMLTPQELAIYEKTQEDVIDNSGRKIIELVYREDAPTRDRATSRMNDSIIGFNDQVNGGLWSTEATSQIIGGTVDAETIMAELDIEMRQLEILAKRGDITQTTLENYQKSLDYNIDLETASDEVASRRGDVSLKDAKIATEQGVLATMALEYQQSIDDQFIKNTKPIFDNLVVEYDRYVKMIDAEAKGEATKLGPVWAKYLSEETGFQKVLENLNGIKAALWNNASFDADLTYEPLQYNSFGSFIKGLQAAIGRYDENSDDVSASTVTTQFNPVDTTGQFTGDPEGDDYMANNKIVF